MLSGCYNTMESIMNFSGDLRTESLVLLFNRVQLRDSGPQPPRLPVHRIFQARTLELVAISASRGSSQTRDQTRVSCVYYIGRGILCPLSHQRNPRASQFQETEK